MNYVWAVWSNNRLVGYVRSPSEWDALRLAKEKFGSYTFVERSWLGNPIPEGQDHQWSYSSSTT
jgi:hypothetical protein